MMKRLIIFFDADDVLVDSSLPAVDRYNATYGESLRYDDLVNYVDDQFFPPGQSIEKPYYGEPGFFRTFKPFPGAQDLVQKLADDGHELYIATASKLSVIADKTACYDEHFPAFHSKHRNVIPILNKSLLVGSVIIDDLPSNLVNSPCPLRILIDRPWNRLAEGDFVRCRSYDEVYHHIQDYISTL